LKTLNGTITISPTTATVGTELTAAYSGSETVSYQWNKDGTAIVGKTTTKHTPTEAGSYTATVSLAGYNSKTSAAVVVTSVPVEKTYLAPNTRVTIKYMGLESDTELPAEISKLAGIFTISPASYSALNRTIYVIDGSAAACSIRSDGTMEAGRKWIIDTPTDDVDDAIYDLIASWLAMIKMNAKETIRLG
jgi:hypothetical protein